MKSTANQRKEHNVEMDYNAVADNTDNRGLQYFIHSAVVAHQICEITRRECIRAACVS